MTRSFTLTISALLLSTCLHGQTRSETLRWTINAGVTYSNATGDVDNESFVDIDSKNIYTNGSAGKEFIVGKKLGLGISKDISQWLSFMADFNYEEKGSKIPITSYSYIKEDKRIQQKIDKKASLKLRYLILPLKVELRYKQLFLEGDLYGGFLLNAYDYGEINAICYKYDKSGLYTKFDGGITLGIGTRIKVSDKNRIKVGLGGSWNLPGNQSILAGSGSSNFYNQTYSIDLKFERKF